jgi:hypothetical protein
VDDSAGVEIRDRLTYRADTAACPAGKATVEELTAGLPGDLGVKGGIYFSVGHCHNGLSRFVYK